MHCHMAQPSFVHLNTRLSFLVIGGTAIAIVIGGTVVIREMPSFTLVSYLASKLSGLIPWRSAAAVDSNRLVEGVELGERDGGGSSNVEIVALRQELAEAKVREERNAGQLEELEGLRNEVVHLKQELEESRAVNKDVETLMATVEELRAKEDRGNLSPSTGVVGDVYSAPLDTVPQDEVVKLVISLNQEILQLAKSVSLASSTARPPPRLPSEELSEEVKEAVAGVAEILGPRMVELLQSPRHAPVQMALQASMTAYTHWIISSWYFENPEDEHLLSEIYARVRETEEQTVSGRWRALTRTHLQRMLSTEPDLTIYMIDAFVNIILTAGWHNDAAALQDSLMQSFATPIDQVLKAAQKLNKVIGEGITSCDLEALYIAPDVLFNETTMDISEDQIGGHYQRRELATDRAERVLCTTDLGLVRAEKKMGKVGEWDEAVLLKPSVVLQSSVGG